MQIFRPLLALLLLCLPLAASAQTAEPFAAEIAAFEAADARAMPEPYAVLFLGSSSIRMWHTLAADFPHKRVLNRGFGGSQIADSIRYADRIAIKYKPQRIVFYAGENDIQAGKTPQQVLSDYMVLVSTLRARLPWAHIVFISLKPSIARWDKIEAIRETNRLIRKYSDTSRSLHFIDIEAAMLGPDGKPRPELYLKDGLHMTPAGYAIWTKALRGKL